MDRGESDSIALVLLSNCLISAHDVVGSVFSVFVQNLSFMNGMELMVIFLRIPKGVQAFTAISQ